MNDLFKYRLSDYYFLGSGVSTSKTQAGHGFPFLSFSKIFNNYFVPDVLDELMDTTEKDRSICSIKAGDIFLTRTSETVDELAMSCVALRNYHNATFSGFAKRLRQKNDKVSNVLDAKFMAFFLRSPYFRKIINNKTTMTLRASFNEVIFNDICFDAPDIINQKKIGNLFYLIEEKIRINNRINDNLQQQITCIYNYWFNQFEFPNADGLPYKSNGGLMKWSKILKREIPISWDISNFMNLTTWESNSQPPKSQFKYKPLKGYVRFIQNRDYESNNYKTYIPISKNLSIVDEFDILMDKYGDAGATRYGIAGAFNVALGKITPNDINYQEYIRSYLEDKSIYNFLHNSCMASTRASLSEANLGNLNILLPEQQGLLKYQDIARKLRKQILDNKKQNEQFITIRDYLLPLLMNGQATIDE